MKVIFSGFKYEYGRPEWGLATIEYQNFFGTLAKMSGVEAQFFAVDEVMKEVGREEMNQKLIRNVQESKPDLLFTMIFQEEIKKETIEYITKKTSTKTFNWFTDDHWRLPIFSRYWAPLFTAVGTTDSKAPEKYRKLGITNVIKTQWGVNHWLYQPKYNNNHKDNYNITFVGKNYGKRGKYIGNLQKAGLPAQGFGKGWSGGVVDFSQMLEIFSGSKINLNFTESYFSWPKELVKLLVNKEMASYKFTGHKFANNFSSFLGKFRRQIKGRTFEVPACGGFLLTGDADNLSDYYQTDKEIIIFRSHKELQEKCRYYLLHNQERQAIAKAGFERTMKDHTYENRFNQIFKALGLI